MMDSSTTLKLSLTREGVGTPNTGLFTSTASGATISNNIAAIILTVMSIALVVAMIVGIVAYIKRKQAGFSISSRATALFRMFMAFAIVCSAGCAGGAVFAANNGVYAEEGESSQDVTADDGPGGSAQDQQDLIQGNTIASNVVSTTLGTIEEIKELHDEEVEFYKVDQVKVTNATPAGYKLYMKVDTSYLKNTASDAKIASVTTETSANEVVAGTWGYEVAVQSHDSISKIPTEYTLIKSINEATQAEDVTSVYFGGKVAANQELGDYIANIRYAVVANPASYTLTYDANGGTFEGGATTYADTSAAVITPTYDFTITNKVPTTTTPGLNFYGWSVTGDGLSDIYAAGETFTATSTNITLKAVWGYKKNTITYNKNIANTVTVNNFIASQFCIITTSTGTSCEAKITERVPNAEGYSLLGWSKTAYTYREGDTIDTARNKVEYKPGDQLTLSADMQLYAVWWEVSTADFQIELRWGENPRDVDSHLDIIEKSTLRSVGHVYFSNKNVQLGEGEIRLEAALDIDDTTSYGPETITINALPLSTYNNYDMFYYIKNYSGESSAKLKDSGAYIVVFRRGSSQETRIDVSTAAGASDTYWNVFVIRNGQIVVKNTMSHDPDVNY